jgi:late competence protein required for DNA uptake (superfamily II DNA/RNA helicase)
MGYDLGRIQVAGHLFLLKKTPGSDEEIFLSDDEKQTPTASGEHCIRVQDNLMFGGALKSIAREPKREQRCVFVTGYVEKPASDGAYCLNCVTIKRVTEAQLTQFFEERDEREQNPGWTI